jgi:hypothetical protein
MGIGTFTRYIGSFCLLAATALLIVADVSAPVVNHLAILRIKQGDGEINFGTFGWCVRPATMDDRCSNSHIGYDPLAIASETIPGIRGSKASRESAEALTNVMVLHAVATGLFFIAFLLSLGKGVFVSLLATCVTIVGFLCNAVAVITDFVGFSIVRRRVRRSNTSATAEWGAAAWCVLAAAVLALIAMVLVFITCCAGRREKKRATHSRKVEYDGPATPVTRRRHFWQRRSAY